MQKFLKKRSQKAGLPPGALVHIGEKRTGRTKISVIDYDESGFEEREIETVQECFLFRNRPGVTWINVDGLGETGVLTSLGECYGFHPLVLEDILNTDQRPKMEDYGDYIYIVLKMLRYDDRRGDIVAEQISLIVGDSFIISFQEGIDGDVFTPLRERIRNNKSRVRRMAADYLVYSLLDAVVDNYFTVIEKLGDKIESIEEMLVGNPAEETLREIHFLKREMIFLRRAVWPLREVIGGMERGDSPLVRESSKIYFRDVYDHTIQVIDTIETFRDMVSGMLDIYLSSVSNRLNAVMKVLTIIATIFMPLTFIVGVYGMNFRHMPELQWRYGYPAVWLVMIVTGLSMLIYFRKKKWL